MNNFSYNLKQLRLSKKLKQVELANKLMVTQRKVSYWELGMVEPDIDMLWLIADFFDVSIDELVGRE